MDIAVAGSLVIDHKSTEPAPCSAQVTVQTDIQRGAYEILAEHLRILAKYVTDVINGNAPEDHEILHDIYTICCNMPVLDERDERFHELMLQQKTDVMLAEYLGLLTEQLDVVNSMIYKSNVIIEQATKKDRGGRIGDLFGTDIKGRFEGKVGMSRMSMRNIK
ncbi:COP9 signalosome complex subunit 6 [Spiromyces aspiralis]|uniref:COP9 signalosome complex subunit 6 n=1 Tax=Spiromyces aspiralis TaxID=68401 RepID=A0ACC1HAI1_9FUNG|nr:COP9 signalosome complex subunit 6 [Spiromyces aspiralis]